MTVLQRLLIYINSCGGIVKGTCSLYDPISADEAHIRNVLAYARRHRLIASDHNKGGRGKLAIHRITEKGKRYVQSA